MQAQRQAAQATQATPRREPAPCPAASAGTAPERLGFRAALGHTTSEYAPPRRALERLAELSTFRI